MYSKPLISRKPLNWTIGCHQAENCSETDENLYLIHLHRIDYNFCKQKLSGIKKSEWCTNALIKNHSWHKRLEGVEFDWWFKSFPWESGPLEVIPRRFKRIL